MVGHAEIFPQGESKLVQTKKQTLRTTMQRNESGSDLGQPCSVKVAVTFCRLSFAMKSVPFCVLCPFLTVHFSKAPIGTVNQQSVLSVNFVLCTEFSDD